MQIVRNPNLQLLPIYIVMNHYNNIYVNTKFLHTSTANTSIIHTGKMSIYQKTEVEVKEINLLPKIWKLIKEQVTFTWKFMSEKKMSSKIPMNMARKMSNE